MRDRTLLVDAALIAVVHALLCVAVRALGFDHVSDDDFARVTIAQLFAHHAKLDPSGTSWLPFPFWVLGAALAVLGRSLATARVVSVIVASLAAATPYLALRYAGATRARGLAATAFVFLSPWSLWLGATTVPESMTASLAAAASIALGTPRTHRSALAPIAFAFAMLGACLSRYEPWPAAAVLALGVGWHSVAGGSARRGHALTVTALLASGPLVWMAWNAATHGDALHFFHRVSSYKRAIGEGATSTADALLAYPRLLLSSRPDVMIASAGAFVLFVRNVEARRRWSLPLLAVAGQLVFLAVGNARDGAPAHHPERALLGTFFVLGLFAADVLVEAMGAAWSDESSRRRILLTACIVGISSAANAVRTLALTPGRSEAEDRAAQIARGAELRTNGSRRLTLTPCAFEHFALVAAFGAPENVDMRPKTGATVTADCPKVDEAR